MNLQHTGGKNSFLLKYLNAEPNFYQVILISSSLWEYLASICTFIQCSYTASELICSSC